MVSQVSRACGVVVATATRAIIAFAHPSITLRRCCNRENLGGTQGRKLDIMKWDGNQIEDGLHALIQI